MTKIGRSDDARARFVLFSVWRESGGAIFFFFCSGEGKGLKDGERERERGGVIKLNVLFFLV